eukprot:CAMPEP_0115205136 /NCGR_PEP_ID=MMETSP0270-20121206/19529_1 /TAXON_ID=71861 /ORGANISM="Scrippsiella trochoidea, Strain CCMP3099" /LENGTH=86 /DNA_ID=CAMNT_0002618657 /DNA_START=228 /DNA_END=488 /DNA_ORIENTATION=+
MEAAHDWKAGTASSAGELSTSLSEKSGIDLKGDCGTSVMGAGPCTNANGKANISAAATAQAMPTPTAGDKRAIAKQAPQTTPTLKK